MARKKNDIEEVVGNEPTNISEITPNSQLMTILKTNKGDHLNFQKRVSWQISTGSLLLDMAIGKFIKPSIIRLVGQNNEGKSPEMLEILRNFLVTVETPRGILFLAEGRLSDENKERCGLKFTTDPNDWNDGEILIIESNVYEFIIGIIKDLVLNNHFNKKYCFCIDSLDGVIRREDLSRPTEDAQKVCGPRVLSKKMLQSLSLGMFKYGHLMIITSQVTAAPKINQYEKTIDRGGDFSGGNALLHGADWIFTMEKSYQSDFILDNPKGKLNDGKTKAIGKYAKITIDKANIETSKKQKVIYPIKFGRKPSGIWLEGEIVSILLSFDLCKMAAAGWITINEELIKEIKENIKDVEIPVKIQGMDNLRKYLEDNPKVTEFLFKKIKSTLL